MGGIHGSREDRTTGGGSIGSGIGSSGRNDDEATGGDDHEVVLGIGGSIGSGIGSSGRNDDEATGGDDREVVLGIRGTSHGRGMRSSDEGVVRLTGGSGMRSGNRVVGRIGGNGISSGVGDLFHGVGIIGVASLCGGDGISDGGRGISMGSSMIMGGGSYCSMDEYCLRCNPQGARGSGGVATRGGSGCGRLGSVGMKGGANGDGSTSGGDGTLGITGGNGVFSSGKDDDGWMNGRMIGGGPTGDNGLTAGVTGGGSGIVTVVEGPPVPPEKPELNVDAGEGNLLLIVFLRPLRIVRSPSRNV